MTERNPIETVVARLEAHGRRVIGGMARCPAHADTEPSLHVSVAADGRVLLHCFAGCDLADVLLALDLRLRDLYPAGSRTRSHRHSERLPPSRSRKSPAPTPTPAGQFSANTGDEGGERRGAGEAALFRQIEEWRAGRLIETDVPLRLDRISPQAAALRSIAEWIRLLMGLRLTDGDADPLPFSISLCIRLMGWDPVRDTRLASKRIHGLENLRVIREVAPPAGTEDWRTRCFQPADFDLATLLGGAELAVERDVGATQTRGARVEADAVLVEPSVSEPTPEVDHDTVMHRAEPAARHDTELVTAPRDAASHAAEDTPVIGAGSGPQARLDDEEARVRAISDRRVRERADRLRREVEGER